MTDAVRGRSCRKEERLSGWRETFRMTRRTERSDSDLRQEVRHRTIGELVEMIDRVGW
jgi:hypothetical protein